MSDAVIRGLRAADVDTCAAIHLDAFPGFFLSRLGPRFLREFYRGFLDDPDGIALVAVDATDTVLGVVVGTLRPDGFFSRLLRRRWRSFALASVRLVVRHPAYAPRLLRAVRYRGQVPLAVSGALLSSICVRRGVQARGAGRRLISAFQDAVRAADTTAYLLTDRHDNQRANDFYRRNGWSLAGSFETREGRSMNCFTYDPEDDIP